MKPRTLNVDLPEIVRAMADDRLYNEYYLDLAAGEVLPLSTDALVRVDNGYPLDDLPDWQRHEARLCREALGDPQRFVRVYQATSDAMLRLMSAFVDRLQLGDIETKLLRTALHNRSPVLTFRQLAVRMRGLSENWREFERQGMYEWATGWLLSIGVRVAEAARTPLAAPAAGELLPASEAAGRPVSEVRDGP